MKMLKLAIAIFAVSYVARPVQAETTNCINITSVPRTITAAGVYCLKQDLNTAITSGNAITINANNVTIDFNEFRLGDLAAGPTTAAVGVFASNRKNITIRNATIRGFRIGIQIAEVDSSGHVIEDNLVDGSTFTGISTSGNGIIVRRNRIVNTDATRPSSQTISQATMPAANSDQRTAKTSGISNGVAPMAGNGGVSNGIRVDNLTNSQIVDNLVTTSISPDTEAEGIFIRLANRVEVGRNTIFNVRAQSFASGIFAEQSQHLVIKDNVIGGGSSTTQATSGTAFGIEIALPSGPSMCLNNTVSGFASGAVTGCTSTAGTFP